MIFPGDSGGLSVAASGEMQFGEHAAHAAAADPLDHRHRAGDDRAAEPFERAALGGGEAGGGGR
jgi:hypothetical protein